MAFGHHWEIARSFNVDANGNESRCHLHLLAGGWAGLSVHCSDCAHFPETRTHCDRILVAAQLRLARQEFPASRFLARVLRGFLYSVHRVVLTASHNARNARCLFPLSTLRFFTCFGTRVLTNGLRSRKCVPCGLRRQQRSSSDARIVVSSRRCDGHSFSKKRVCHSRTRVNVLSASKFGTLHPQWPARQRAYLAPLC